MRSMKMGGGGLLTAAFTIGSQTEQPVPPPGGVLW